MQPASRDVVKEAFGAYVLLRLIEAHSKFDMYYNYLGLFNSAYCELVQQGFPLIHSVYYGIGLEETTNI